MNRKVGSALQPKSLAARCLCGTEKHGQGERGGSWGRLTCSNLQWVSLPSGCCWQLKHSTCFNKCWILLSNIRYGTGTCELGPCLPQALDYSQWKESRLQRAIQLSYGWDIFLAVHKGRKQWGTHQRAVKCWKWISAHWAFGTLKGTITRSLQCPCT